MWHLHTPNQNKMGRGRGVCPLDPTSRALTSDPNPPFWVCLSVTVSPRRPRQIGNLPGVNWIHGWLDPPCPQLLSDGVATPCFWSLRLPSKLLRRALPLPPQSRAEPMPRSGRRRSAREKRGRGPGAVPRRTPGLSSPAMVRQQLRHPFWGAMSRAGLSFTLPGPSSPMHASPLPPPPRVSCSA